MINQSSLATETDNTDILAYNLRRLMSVKNISEAELARQTNIPQPTLHKILAGRTSDPRTSTIKLLANFFSVSIDTLISGMPIIESPTTYSQVKTQSIPIITWTECINATKLIKTLTPTTWEHWIVTEFLSDSAYALTSRPCMEPRFPRGSVLIIDPLIAPEDGDLVVVYYRGTEEATIRKISLDGPTKELLNECRQPATATPFDSETELLGVLVKSIFKFHQ